MRPILVRREKQGQAPPAPECVVKPASATNRACPYSVKAQQSCGAVPIGPLNLREAVCNVNERAPVQMSLLDRPLRSLSLSLALPTQYEDFAIEQATRASHHHEARASGTATTVLRDFLVRPPRLAPPTFTIPPRTSCPAGCSMSTRRRHEALTSLQSYQPISRGVQRDPTPSR